MPAKGKVPNVAFCLFQTFRYKHVCVWWGVELEASFRSSMVPESRVTHQTDIGTSEQCVNRYYTLKKSKSLTKFLEYKTDQT